MKWFREWKRKIVDEKLLEMLKLQKKGNLNMLEDAEGNVYLIKFERQE